MYLLSECSCINIKHVLFRKETQTHITSKREQNIDGNYLQKCFAKQPGFFWNRSTSFPVSLFFSPPGKRTGLNFFEASSLCSRQLDNRPSGVMGTSYKSARKGGERAESVFLDLFQNIAVRKARLRTRKSKYQSISYTRLPTKLKFLNGRLTLESLRVVSRRKICDALL